MAFSNPVTTTPSGETYIDALMWGSHWQSPGAGTNLAVWIAGAAGTNEQFDFGGVTVTANNAPQENDAFVAAFQTIANVCGLNFTAAASQADADIIVGTVNNRDASGNLGIAVPPGEDVGPTGQQQGAVIINWRQYSTTDLSSLLQGGYDFVAYIHEIGHALGLKHPHNNLNGFTTFPGVGNGNSFGDLGDFDLNQGLYTMMTYNDGWQTRPGGPLLDTGVVTYGYEATPMALDIAALQYLYGVNTSYKAGNDSYVMPSANLSGTFYACLWDAGGIDTIRNASALASRIDLRAATLGHDAGGGGYLSFVGGIDGGFTIANGAVIENASGGSAADWIIGNDAANKLRGNGGVDTIDGGSGADQITGGTGRDLLTGGGGRDVFIFAATADSSGAGDLITDFVAGLDDIRLSAIDAIAGGADDLFSFIGTTLFGNVAGQLRFEQDAATNLTRIEGDTDGNGTANFTIRLTGLHVLAAGDFFL